MGNQTRDVEVVLGKKSYALRTTLDAEELERLQLFSSQLFDSLEGVYDQERKLFLGWMFMAYELDKAEQRLLELLRSVGNEQQEEEGNRR